MNTPAHGFWGYILTYVLGWQKNRWVMVAGSIYPDLIYVLAFILGYFNFWYHEGVNSKLNLIEIYSNMWDHLGQVRDVPWIYGVESFGHSLLIWLGIYLISRWVKLYKVTAFSIGVIFHIAIDAVTHVQDGSPLFWPLSVWNFPAPISYWDPAFGGQFFSWINTLLILVFIVLGLINLLRRKLI